MNKAIALLLLCGVLVSMCAHADGTKITHPDWAIILTITDLATGAQLEQLELDSELRFDDPIECKSIVAKVGRVPATDHFAAVLTCRKVRLMERDRHGGHPMDQLIGSSMKAGPTMAEPR